MDEAHNGSPLLGHQPSEEEVPEDLEHGLSAAPGHDFRHLIEAQPDAVIKFVTFTRSCARVGANWSSHMPALLLNPPCRCRHLEKHGVTQLGSFSAPVCPVCSTNTLFAATYLMQFHAEFVGCGCVPINSQHWHDHNGQS